MHNRTYNVYLERKSTGSAVTVQISAMSDEQARKKAQDELPQWQVVGVTVP